MFGVWLGHEIFVEVHSKSMFSNPVELTLIRLVHILGRYDDRGRVLQQR